MKFILKNLLIFLIMIAGCDTSLKVELNGTLGENLKSSFQLNQDGDKFSGFFTYDTNKSDKISVSGVRNGHALRIEEFNNNENKLTGIFEGEFDGITFKGFWQDPKKEKRVPFIYHIEKMEDEKRGKKEQEKKVEIKYLVSEPYGSVFYEKLDAEIGKKKYEITDAEDSGMIVRIIDVRDFDNDGYSDVLVEENCGGTACPFGNLFFSSFNPKKDKFEITESFGSILEKPKIEKWNGKWSINITSFAIMELYRADERYIYEKGNPIRVEYKEAKKLKAVKEMTSEDFNGYETRNKKVIKFDLDGDGKDDSIIGDYWDRWNSINWEIKFQNGKSFSGEAAYLRIGILSSKTNGIHDLVLGLDYVFIWTGEKYEEKKTVLNKVQNAHSR